MKTVLLESKKEIILKPVEDTQYVLIPKGEISVEISIEKEGVSSDLLIAYLLVGKDSVTLKTKSLHVVPNTSCSVEVKAGLFDGSSSEYEGQIIIPKGSQQTNSFLKDDVLLLGEKVKNVSKPILEIEANDVKASHGATSGRIREEQLYYLMSRGLTRDEAEKMILVGFFESLLTKIEDEKIKEKVRTKLLPEGVKASVR